MTHSMTKTSFILALREAMIALYGQPHQTGIEGWAKDTKRLEKFLDRTAETIRTDITLVTIEGPAFVNAWHAIGGKGRPTYRGLRALPDKTSEAA